MKDWAVGRTLKSTGITAIGSSHDPWGGDRVHKEEASRADVQTLMKRAQRGHNGKPAELAGYGTSPQKLAGNLPSRVLFIGKCLAGDTQPQNSPGRCWWILLAAGGCWSLHWECTRAKSEASSSCNVSPPLPT